MASGFLCPAKVFPGNPEVGMILASVRLAFGKTADVKNKKRKEEGK